MDLSWFSNQPSYVVLWSKLMALFLYYYNWHVEIVKYSNLFCLWCGSPLILLSMMLIYLDFSLSEAYEEYTLFLICWNFTSRGQIWDLNAFVNLLKYHPILFSWNIVLFCWYYLFMSWNPIVFMHNFGFFKHKRNSLI